MKQVHLGYEIGSGGPVSIPIRHMAVTGQTQEAGKTTTLEALITRGAADGLRAVAFVTKRGERSFQTGTRIKPYFKERADWRFLASVLEATMQEKLKFERPWIIRAAKGAKTLADVQRNVGKLMESAKGIHADQYLKLDEYLKIVVPQIARLPYGDKVSLVPGLNIMDLGGYSSELQGLVIRSVLEWVYEREEGVVVVIPEAWEFIPQRRGSPVKLAAEEFIRKGASLRNYLWLDSQDIAGVDTATRKSVIVWLLGVQREENEVKRTLSYIIDAPKPKVDDIMRLGKGEFFVCHGSQARKVYVQPAWMAEDVAKLVARGENLAPPPGFDGKPLTPAEVIRAVQEIRVSVGHAPTTVATGGTIPPTALFESEEDEMSAEEREQYESRISKLNDAYAKAEGDNQRLRQAAAALDVRAAQAEKTVADLQRQFVSVNELKRAWAVIFGGVAAGGNTGTPSTIDVDEVVQAVLRRISTTGGGAPVYQVAPVEKLRKDYQQREVERILEAVKAFSVTSKDILALVEMTDQYLSQQTIAARLGKGMGGWLAQHLKPMIDQGFIESKERQGVCRRLRQKIADDLAHYGATEDEVEQTYQNVMALVASGELVGKA